jgi:hypothetical protein
MNLLNVINEHEQHPISCYLMTSTVSPFPLANIYALGGKPVLFKHLRFFLEISAFLSGCSGLSL